MRSTPDCEGFHNELATKSNSFDVGAWFKCGVCSRFVCLLMLAFLFLLLLSHANVILCLWFFCGGGGVKLSDLFDRKSMGLGHRAIIEFPSSASAQWVFWGGYWYFLTCGATFLSRPLIWYEKARKRDTLHFLTLLHHGPTSASLLSTCQKAQEFVVLDYPTTGRHVYRYGCFC